MKHRADVVDQLVEAVDVAVRVAEPHIGADRSAQDRAAVVGIAVVPAGEPRGDGVARAGVGVVRDDIGEPRERVRR